MSGRNRAPQETCLAGRARRQGYVHIDAAGEKRIPHHDGGGLVWAFYGDDRAHGVAAEVQAERCEFFMILTRRSGSAASVRNAALAVATVDGDGEAVNI